MMSRIEQASDNRPTPSGRETASVETPTPPETLCGSIPTDTPGPNADGRRGWMKLMILGLVVSGVTAAAWLYITRNRSPLEYAPATALAYVEVRDTTGALDALQRTRAWHRLTPFLPDAAAWRVPPLLGSHIAVVLTGLELEGEKLTPHWALLVRSPGGAAAARAGGHRLESLARRLLGPLKGETRQEQGLSLTLYRDPQNRVIFLWTVMDGMLVAANREDSLRSLKETRQKRHLSLAAATSYRTLRAAVDRQSPIVGFISGKALRSLLQRSVISSASPATSWQAAAELVETITAPLSLTLTFSVDVEGGEVVSRYILGLDPKASASLGEVVNGQAELKSPAIIPADARRITIYRFGDFRGVVEAVEEVVAERLSPLAQIVVRELTGRMKQSLGWARSDTLADALGDESAIVEWDGDRRLLIAQAREKAKLAMLIGKHLRQTGEPVREEQYQGYSIFFARKRPTSAFSFINGFLVIGQKQEIETLIDRCRQNRVIANHPQLASLFEQGARGAFEVMVSFDHSEVVQAVLTLRDFAGAYGGISSWDVEALHRAVRELAPETRISRWQPEGVYSESRSPLGPLALILNMIEVERVTQSASSVSPGPGPQ